MITETLTRREANVVECIAVDNLTVKETAAKLCVVNQCIKGHIQHIYDKLGIKRNLQALTKWYYTGGREQIKATMLMLVFLMEINTTNLDGRMLRTRARRRSKDEIEAIVDWEGFI
ncbi:MAG: hypothetical protein J1E33_06270 [Alistipes sp.]|nr:hypothetical protein [Alistipes sp.]